MTDEKRAFSYADFSRQLAGRGDVFVFRGQPDCEFSLLPSGLRGRQTIASDRQVFRFVDEMRRLFNFDELTCIEIAQHFALPTRMLDFSYSFDVALFFACNDKRFADYDGEVFIFNKSRYEDMLKTRNKLSGQVIRNNKFLYDWLQRYVDNKTVLFGDGGVDLPIFVDATMQFDRLAMQKGLFLLWGTEELTLEGIMAKEGLALGDYVDSIVIDAASKPAILSQLEQRNICEDTLYMNIARVRDLIGNIRRDGEGDGAYGKQQ